MTQESSDNHIIMELKTGNVKIELYPEIAPNHVERMKTLTRDGFYNGIVFHRVIEGFMAQTGDPTGTGTGGSHLPDLAAEFNDTPHTRGVLSMARSSSPNSANSQFFICFEASEWLDGQYTAFGKVIEGMEHIDAVKKGQGSGGMVNSPDSIISMKLAHN